MIKKAVRVALATLLAAVICSTAVVAQDQQALKSKKDAGEPPQQVPEASKPIEDDGTGVGIAAIQRAAKAKKYLFVFFYRSDDDRTRATRKVFEAAMEEFADRAMSVAVNTGDLPEKEIVEKFRVGRAPMPLILALAPNGAITKAFVRDFDEQQLAKAFVSPREEECLKLLQERKLVFVCIQNESTQHNTEALEGVQEFKADQRYAKFTEIVTLDPRDEMEGELLKKLRVDPGTEEAITVVLAPPGRPIGTFKGATSKNALVAVFQKGCAPGSGCCGPKKKPSGDQPGTTKNP